MPAAPTERVLPARGACANHPARTPVGRCARCRKSACAECVTRLDGILHCRDCLAVAAGELRKPERGFLPRLATLAAAIVLLIPGMIISLATLRGVGMVGEAMSHWMAIVEAEGE